MKRNSNDKKKSSSVKLKIQTQKFKSLKINQMFELVQKQIKVFA